MFLNQTRAYLKSQSITSSDRPKVMERRISYCKISYTTWVGYVMVQEETEPRHLSCLSSSGMAGAFGLFLTPWICIALGSCHITLERSRLPGQKVVNPSAQRWLLHNLSDSTFSWPLCLPMSIISYRAITLWSKLLTPTYIQIWAPWSARFSFKLELHARGVIIHLKSKVENGNSILEHPNAP